MLTDYAMAFLRHEVWEESDEHDRGFCLCLAGPDGESARGCLEPGARLIHVFEAGSWYEAMTIYNRLLGWGPYKADDLSVREPYPEERRRRQT
jgi:hypothetical protein